MLLSRAAHRSLTRARELLEADEPLARSVADIALEVGISPFHFIRRFESVFGMTPHQARIRARIERAKELLRAGHNVTDTCMAVGFSSLGSFSSAFTRRVGVSPSIYQRQPPAVAPCCYSLMANAFAISKKHDEVCSGTLPKR